METHDREILDEYINLDNSCLHEEEKREVMDMLFNYKEAFSLRDEIGTCPNIEVEIDVMDKSPFFIRPYHVTEEDKAFIDCLQNRKYWKAIMDDVLLFTPSKKSHMDKVEDLLKALLKNGLKISPKKCQLFRTN